MKKRKVQKRERARSQRRRSERAAAKRAMGRGVPRPANGLWPFQIITPTDGSQPHLFDDCPICRAMKEVGVALGTGGVVAMTPEQHEQYERRLEEIVAEEGLPNDAMWVSGEEMRRAFEEIIATLEANGYPTDMDSMDDDEFDAHLLRVMEVIAARESAGRDRAAAARGN